MRAIGRLAAGLLLYALFEGALFHTGFYSSILDPSSSTGTLETLVRNEQNRAMADHNQVLCVGDSRMGILPRMAN